LKIISASILKNVGGGQRNRKVYLCYKISGNSLKTNPLQQTEGDLLLLKSRIQEPVIL